MLLFKRRLFKYFLLMYFVIKRQRKFVVFLNAYFYIFLHDQFSGPAMQICMYRVLRFGDVLHHLITHQPDNSTLESNNSPLYDIFLMVLLAISK